MHSEAAVRRYFKKPVGLKVLHNSRENYWESLSSKVTGVKRLKHRCFPVNIARFPREHLLRENFTEHFGSMLLDVFSKTSFATEKRVWG